MARYSCTGYVYIALFISIPMLIGCFYLFMTKLEFCTLNNKAISDGLYRDDWGRNLPQAICIGSKKSGTGTLMKFMGLNPYINAHRGEMHFFDQDKMYEEGIQTYFERMPASTQEQVTMEKTPKYLVYTKAAPRIWEMNSSAKIIVILRDPIKRLISDYDHESRLGNRPYVRIEKSFALQDLVFSRDGGLNITYEPVAASMYDVHIYRWLQYFPREQLLVLDGEKFIKEPLPILRQCEEFLGIPHHIQEDMFVVDEERGYYCVKADGCSKSKGHTHTEYPEDFLDRLRALYAPHNDRLVALLDQTFSWYTPTSS